MGTLFAFLLAISSYTTATPRISAYSNDDAGIQAVFAGNPVINLEFPDAKLGYKTLDGAQLIVSKPIDLPSYSVLSNSFVEVADWSYMSYVISAASPFSVDGIYIENSGLMNLVCEINYNNTCVYGSREIDDHSLGGGGVYMSLEEGSFPPNAGLVQARIGRP